MLAAGPYAGPTVRAPNTNRSGIQRPMDNRCIEATVAADQLCDDFAWTRLRRQRHRLCLRALREGHSHEAGDGRLELTYGNHAAMIELIKKIGRREGIGDVLAEGVMRAARMIGKGAESCAIHVKGMEPPAYEPRGAKCLGFTMQRAT